MRYTVTPVFKVSTGWFDSEPLYFDSEAAASKEAMLLNKAYEAGKQAGVTAERDQQQGIYKTNKAGASKPVV